MAAVLFMHIEGKFTPYVSPTYRTRGYLVPEERVLELVTAEDMEAWTTHGFQRYGEGHEMLERSYERLEAALRAFEAADWVVKIDRRPVYGGVSFTAPPGVVISRTLVGLPEWCDYDIAGW